MLNIICTSLCVYHSLALSPVHSVCKFIPNDLTQILNVFVCMFVSVMLLLSLCANITIVYDMLCLVFGNCPMPREKMINKFVNISDEIYIYYCEYWKACPKPKCAEQRRASERESKKSIWSKLTSSVRTVQIKCIACQMHQVLLHPEKCGIPNTQRASKQKYRILCLVFKYFFPLPVSLVLLFFFVCLFFRYLLFASKRELQIVI